MQYLSAQDGSGEGQSDQAPPTPPPPVEPAETAAETAAEQNKQSAGDIFPNIERVSITGSSVGVDGSKVIYDREKGLFPDSPVEIGVSPTLVGAGFKFDLDRGPTDLKPRYPDGALRISAGLRNLGVEADPDLSRPSIKIGYGLGSPVGPSSDIDTFTGFLNQSAKDFNEYTAGASGFLNSVASRLAGKIKY